MKKTYHQLSKGSAPFPQAFSGQDALKFVSDETLGAYAALALRDPMANPEETPSVSLQAVTQFLHVSSKDSTVWRSRYQTVDRCLRVAKVKKLGTHTTRGRLAGCLKATLGKMYPTHFEQMSTIYRDITVDWKHVFYSCVGDPDENSPLIGEILCPIVEMIGGYLALAFDPRTQPYPGHREGLWAVDQYLQAANAPLSVR